jgi:cytochrome c biogenesis protein CcmG, thiol:disulfide interchange protein DsbE
MSCEKEISMRTIPAFLAIVFALSLCVSAQQAPNFKLVSVKGDTVALSSFKGKIVVVDFWAMWCQACKEAFGNLNTIQKDMAAGNVVVVGINLENANPQKVVAFAKKAGIEYTILLDPKTETAKLFSVKGVPSLVVIDKDQKIVKMFRGLNKSTEKEIHELLVSLAGK